MNIQIKLTRAENLARFNVPKNTVVTLDMETGYLPVVVASEVYENNGRTPMEAKKAQAVAARTYVAAHALAGTVIDDTANYQAFSFKEPSTIPNSAQAVRETAGQVLMCQGKMITAWYSNSNGGRTKRSDEAWSSYKPWTVAKDDPWDALGRAKWGECKASHCVGMSQIGAAYAALAGFDYRKILAFYYIDTELASDYGKNGEIYDFGEKVNRMIKATDLCAYALRAVGGGYCYGSSGEVCSIKNRQAWAVANPSQAANLLGVCAKWDGKKVWDCSGLFRGAWRELDKYKSGGATTIFNTWLLQSGPIGTMPDEPGIALFRGTEKTKEHIGLYIGDGQVVDARGSAKGVLLGPLSSYAWTHWGWLKDVDCDIGDGGLVAMPESEPALYLAQLVNVKVGLNLRSGPVNPSGPDNTILLIPPAATVEVLADNCGADGKFARIRYFGTVGYCTRSYLMQLDEE